ncbi:heat shock protein DnaJ [Trypanosoma theileri]|uniref:Heat shock protein DnaJ n=1 Tax=Trypanosoma theileri TaxID=67003 RepID=A0A1X0P3X0_9TRYP|nr:heat shock protein DnaJ [Trypanosoma theileri]ORC91622.1 heat shock protein DnaJ [Trypanosoma theileri]
MSIIGGEYRAFTGATVLSQHYLRFVHSKRRALCTSLTLGSSAIPTGSNFFTCTMTPARRWQSTAGATDYYARLGVKPDASADEIKAAYKKLALQYHPDRNSDPGAEEMFKNISEAYHVIGNKERRREYDMRRSASSFTGGGNSSGYASSSSTGFNRQGPMGYQHMSKEEADRLFREIFGGMRVEQIFRNLEEEMRRNSMSGRHSRVSQEFSGSEQAFRPFFRNESTRVFTDGHGNRMEEHTYTDPQGKTFTVRKVTSEQPNASTNQKTEEFYSGNASTNRDGRFHYGNSSFKVNPRNFTDDFGQAFFGVRTHGRHPIVAMMIVAAWGIVIGTIVLGFFIFLASHPFFTLAVLFLIFLRRLRYF